VAEQRLPFSRRDFRARRRTFPSALRAAFLRALWDCTLWPLDLPHRIRQHFTDAITRRHARCHFTWRSGVYRLRMFALSLRFAAPFLLATRVYTLPACDLRWPFPFRAFTDFFLRADFPD